MDLSTLKRSDIPDLLESHDVEIRSKSDPIWYHAPAIWIQIAIVWASGKSPRAFSVTLPKFLGGAAVYLSGDYDFEAIRRGEAPLSAMPIIVHELTHAFQMFELGVVWFAFNYTLWPLPVGWTGRATSEFEADGNDIKWIDKYYGLTTEQLQGNIERAAELFTGPTYLWPSFDTQGWIDATKTLLWRDGDARKHTDLVTHFGGYNYRG
jgi:hypothetical protein